MYHDLFPDQNALSYADIQEVPMTKHTVQLPDGLFDHLTSIAAETGQSADDLIVAAIEQHLEDAADLRAIAEYEKQKANGTLETVPFEEVKRRLGLED